MKPATFAFCLLLATAALEALHANVAQAQYARATPGEEVVGAKPSPSFPEPRDQALHVADAVALLAALGLAAWIILRRRSWRWLVVLIVLSLLYFGVYRGGCVCPIGAIQNVVLSLADPTYTISIVVTAIFLLPIILALFFGRVFCGGVCWLGGLQEPASTACPSGCRCGWTSRCATCGGCTWRPRCTSRPAASSFGCWTCG